MVGITDLLLPEVIDLDQYENTSAFEDSVSAREVFGASLYNKNCV